MGENGSVCNRVGGGPALYTGSPEGTGVLVAARGLDPLSTTAVLRSTWT